MPYQNVPPVYPPREQRVTLLVMSVLLGVSIMAYQALQLLPLPLLYGIFLYIGVASLYGVQVSRTLHSHWSLRSQTRSWKELYMHISNQNVCDQIFAVIDLT